MLFFFFFKQKTAYEMRISDWSSDVCSSDLKSKLQTQAASLDHASAQLALAGALAQAYLDLYRAYALADIATQAEQQRETLLKLTQDRVRAGLDTQLDVKSAEALLPQASAARLQAERSEERRVGKEWGSTGRARWAPLH